VCTVLSVMYRDSVYSHCVDGDVFVMSNVWKLIVFVGLCDDNVNWKSGEL
jgi:hypothetical protein